MTHSVRSTTGTVHIFTVPPPLPLYPISFHLKKGESRKEASDRMGELFSLEPLLKAGVIKDDVLTEDSLFQFSLIPVKELALPAQFSYLSEAEQTTVKSIFEILRRGGTMPVVNGGLGDMENCNALVEKKIDLFGSANKA